MRRVKPFLPETVRSAAEAMTPALLEVARLTPSAPWQGQRFDLIRYSARQEAELEMRGVAGFLDLPQGPGALWPLLAALTWLHVGKGTVVGMGQLTVDSL